MSNKRFDDILIYILLIETVDECVSCAIKDFHILFPYSNSREKFFIEMTRHFLGISIS